MAKIGITDSATLNTIVKAQLRSTEMEELFKQLVPNQNIIQC